ncbi:MAG: hypothetical protein ACR2IV_24095 [Bryobacteraceae bacterium]
MSGVQIPPQTTQRFAAKGRSASIDFFASSKISGEIIGSGAGFFFIFVFTIEQIDHLVNPHSSESLRLDHQGFPVDEPPNLGRLLSRHHIAGIERRMAVGALLPGLHDRPLGPRNNFGLHRVSADRTIGEVHA